MCFSALKLNRMPSKFRLSHVTQLIAKNGFQTDASAMAPSANQKSSSIAPANHRATSNYQFESPSKLQKCTYGRVVTEPMVLKNGTPHHPFPDKIKSTKFPILTSDPNTI